MKTPILPMWLTKCDGQLGILFNPNKDIFRNKAAENKCVIIIIITYKNLSIVLYFYLIVGLNYTIMPILNLVNRKSPKKLS